MSSFSERVLDVVRPYIRDSEDPWGLSPCTLKVILYELAKISYTEGDPMHPVIMYVLEHRALPEGNLLSVLRANPVVQGLCSRYTKGPYCDISWADILDRGSKELLLRGGVQELATNPFARLFFQSPYRST